MRDPFLKSLSRPSHAHLPSFSSPPHSSLLPSSCQVFDEGESGIKRWTDGLIWSPSRILSNFLVSPGHASRRANPPFSPSLPLFQRLWSESRWVRLRAKPLSPRPRPRLPFLPLVLFFPFLSRPAMSRDGIWITFLGALELDDCRSHAFGLARHRFFDLSCSPSPPLVDVVLLGPNETSTYLACCCAA